MGAETIIARRRIEGVRSVSADMVTFKRLTLRKEGSSKIKGARSPFKTVEERHFEARSVVKKEKQRTRAIINAERMGLPGARKMEMQAMIAPKRPLQGVRELVRIDINLSCSEGMMALFVTPTQLQPKPMHTVSACLPQLPHFLKVSSKLKAMRGRMPESSKMAKRGKKIAMGGSITEMTVVVVL